MHGAKIPFGRFAVRVDFFERALEGVGYGRFQRRLLVVCGLGWAADAMEVMLLSFALPALSDEWGLDPSRKAALAGAVFVGMLAGSLFWGRWADRLGRRGAFVATIAFDSVFGLASAFAPSFASFVVLRVLTGFGVGGTLPVDYGLFSEFLPAKDRGRKLVLLESFWALGTLAAAGLAWLLVPRLGWRALFAASAAPGLLLAAARGRVPESPRFLLAAGRAEQARAVLERMARENGRAEALRAAEGAAPAPGAQTRAAAPSRLRDLLSPALARTTVLLWLVWFGISVGYYGAFTWLPSWLRSKGVPLPSVYPYAVAMALFQLPGYFSAAYLVEIWGRRIVLGVYLAASGACALLFGFASGTPAVAASAFALSFFALGAWGALYAYTPEAYPTPLRASGIGAASAMARVAGLVAPSLGAAAAVSRAGPLAPLACFAGAYAAAGICAFLLPRETRGAALDA